MIQSVQEVNPLIIFQILRIEAYDIYNEIKLFLLLYIKDEGRTFLSENIYQTTRRRIPQDNILYSYRRENFKHDICNPLCGGCTRFLL
jgi:hypothetical protein